MFRTVRGVETEHMAVKTMCRSYFGVCMCLFLCICSKLIYFHFYNKNSHYFNENFEEKSI